MSFLTPLYIAGLAAVALPALFHLFRRTPRGRVFFSTLMFLQPSPPRVTRRSRIEHWPLLMLRALALCLIAAAFARPFWREARRLASAAKSGRTVALLIDTSASMRREGLWAQALQRAEAVLEQQQVHDRLGVFAFDRDFRPVLSFEEAAALHWAAARETARRRLNALSPGWAGTNLGDALAGVADLLEAFRTAQGSTRPAEIVLISDLQAGSRLDRLEQYAWPSTLSVRMECLAAHPAGNAGLHLAIRPADHLPADETDAVRVCVTNTADSDREQFRLEWWAGDQPLRQFEPIDVYLPAGQSRILRVPLPAVASSKRGPVRPESPPDTAALPGAEGPWRLVLLGDAHAFDNAVDVCPPVRERSTVLYCSSDAADDSQSLRYYLQRALPDAGQRTVEVLSQSPSGPALLPDHSDLKLVVATGLPAELDLSPLRRYAERGGTVLVVARHTEDVETFCRLIGQVPIPVAEAIVDGYALLSEIDPAHPLFAPLAEAHFADFSAIRVWRHRAADVSGLNDVRIPARFDDGSPAVVERLQGAGRVILFTFGWHPADSQLALSSKFVPLLNNLLTAAAEGSRRRRFEVGEPVPLPPGLGADDAVHVPHGAEIRLVSNQAAFTETSRPGVYRLSARSVAAPFTVHLAPAESRTEPMPPEHLEALGVVLSKTSEKLTPHEMDDNQRQLQAQELERRQQLWRWLLVSALAVLLLETWFAGTLTLKAAIPTEAVQ